MAVTRDLQHVVPHIVKNETDELRVQHLQRVLHNMVAVQVRRQLDDVPPQLRSKAFVLLLVPKGAAAPSEGAR